jgi:hypothetical protein
MTDDPTISAWATATATATTTFQTARSAEQNAFLARAVSLPSPGSALTPQNCNVSNESFRDAKHCTATLTVDGQKVSLTPAGDKLLAYAQKLQAYGAAMKDAATAKDIADQKAAIIKFGTSAGALFDMIGVPGVSAVTSLASELVSQASLLERRKALSRIAARTQPAIDALADALQRAATDLQRNVVLQNAQVVAETRLRFASIPASDPQRSVVGMQLLQAIDAEKAAASVTFDFTSLKTAHRKMVESLESNKVDTKAALAEIEAVWKQLEDVRKAFEKKS